jgi:uncharacterized membrane protein HdeD (DUF308 family)
MAKDTQPDSNYWWVSLLQGISALIIGWLLIAQPVWTVSTLVVLLGLYWLVAGILEIVFALFDIGTKGSKGGWKLVGGVIALVAGLFVVNNPVFASVITPVMLMYTVAFVFIIQGIINMVVGGEGDSEGKKHEWTWGTFFLGIVYLILGMVLLSSPTLMSVASVVMASALLLIFGGIVGIAVSFKLRKEHKKNV